MSQERRPRRTIATTTMRMTLAVGSVLLVAVTIVGVTSALRLARGHVAAGMRADMQAVEDRIEMRLSAAVVAIDAAAGGVRSASNAKKAVVALRRAYQIADGSVERIVLVPADGVEPISYPSTLRSKVPTEVLSTSPQLAGQLVVRDPSTGKRSVWLLRSTAFGPRGRAVVAAQIRANMLTTILRDSVAKTPGHAVAVLTEDGTVEGAAGVPLDLSTAHWRIESGVGAGDMRSTSGVDMRAVYDRVDSVPALGWRVLVAQPQWETLRETGVAVIPTILVLVLGGALALAMAYVFSVQISRPLASLEAAAYRAAGGSYVKPLRTERTDEIGRLAHAFNAVAVRLNALHDISQLLASSTHLDQVLDGILSAMGHIIGPGITAIYLLDVDGALLVPVRARGAAVDVLPSLPATGGTWIADALSSSEPTVVTGRPGRIEQLLPGLAPHVAREAMAIPLVSGYDSLGLIVYVSEEERGFTEAEVEMLRTFAAQASIAVSTSRMFADEAESREIAETLQAVAEEIASPGNLERALDSVKGRLRTLFAAQQVEVVLSDRTALGMQPSSDESAERRLLEVAQRALALGEQDAPNTVPRGIDPEVDELLGEAGSDELLVVPIAMTSGHGGALVIFAGQTGIRPRDVELADAIGDEISLALDNAYFYERAIMRASNLETIFRISQALSSSLQFQIVLNRVLDVVQKIFSADAVWLMTYDRARRVVRTELARGQVSSEILDLALTPGEDMPGYVFATGQPASVRDIADTATGVQGMAHGLGLRSMIVVPLLARGRSIGVLCVLSCEAGAFSDEDLSVLQTFAAQASLAMDTARLYSREHEVATVLQRSITPEELPELPEIEASAAYVAGGLESEIGGDYYDIIRGADGAIYAAIGDVVGKGLTAATKTSMIKYAVRALVAAGLRPARVLQEVNRMVTESGDPSDIVTLWLGRYDARRRTLSWANGGHPPVLLRRADTGEIDSLGPTGPLLGVASSVRYDEESVAVDPGDMCLMYTDGVTEAREGGMFFGEQRVRAGLEKGGTCEDVVQRLLSGVRMFVEGDLRDDVAIVALSFTGQLEPATPSDEGSGEQKESMGVWHST